jgi:hypothetical protein
MKQPAGDLEIVIKNTNDAGGIRHVALEVSNAVDRYTNQLTVKNHLGTFITKDTPIPLDPFPYTLFHWIDKQVRRPMGVRTRPSYGVL